MNPFERGKMRLQINDRSGRMSEEDRDEARRKILFALSRFTPVIDRAELTISDLNGPRGGIDVQCQCRVFPKRGEPLIVVNRDAGILPCIGTCAKRIGRAVARWIDRKADRQVSLPK